MNVRRLLIATTIFVSAGCLAGQEASAATIPPRKALLHAINHVRASHGVRAVSGSSILRMAALHHSADMVGRDYFGHTSPTGSTFTSRIQGSGFVNGYSWIAGETLAWGWGAHTGASTTVKAWLHSPQHRAILLSSTYRRVGIGRNCGRFLGHADACVWTADFVTRW
jgi:uncharacterized protein YkwD